MGKTLKILKFSLLMSFRNMNHRRFRSLLTIVGIMIGIMTFISLMSITIGMREQIATSVEQLIGAPLIVSSEISGMRPGIPEAMVEQIKTIEGVDYAGGYIMDYMIVGTTYAAVIGVEPGDLDIMYQVDITKGRDLQDGDLYECLIGAAVVEFSVGDKIFIPGGPTGTVELTIVGKLAGLGTPMMDVSVITTLDALQIVMNTDNVMFILVECDVELARNIGQSIKDAYPDASIMESQDILDMANQIIDLIDIVLVVLSGITLLVGAIGIMNTTMMNVLERTREIGILKSIGATRAEVVEIFIIEALNMSLIGGALGCVMAVFTVLAISPLAQMILPIPLPYSFPPYLFVLGMVMAVTIGVVSALYPSLNAASVRPVEALRYE